MKKLFGLPITRKSLTDAEYVERVRKDIERVRRLGKWFALFAAVMAVAWVYLVIRCVQALAGGFLGLPANQLFVGLAVGAAFGLGFGLIALKIGHFVAQAITMWKGDRTSQLLVKYHDALVGLARSERPPEAPDQTGQGRAGEGEDVPSAADVGDGARHGRETMPLQGP